MSPAAKFYDILVLHPRCSVTLDSRAYSTLSVALAAR